jgi:F0F1-type ATP synthase assembly protein I
MSSSALHRVRVKAFWFASLPVGLVLIAAFFFFAWRGMNVGCSVLLGGVVWLLPNFYFVHKVFSKIGAGRIILRTFYRAEITKLLVSAVLFIVVSKIFAVNMPAFLIGFIAAQSTFWLTSLFMVNTTQR